MSTQLTNAEIITLIKENLAIIDPDINEEMWDNFTISINSLENKTEIVISRMYNFVKINFAFLSFLSELFSTKEINLNEEKRKGCPSCDYGSSYTQTIILYNTHPPFMQDPPPPMSN